MPNRLILASTALTAAVAISVIAVSAMGAHHESPAVQGSSAEPGKTSQRPIASARVAGLNPAQPKGQAMQVVAAQANLRGPGAGRLSAVAGARASAPTPTLLTIQGGGHILAQGAQKAVPVAVSENHAMQAIFNGGMWLPNATGGREYAQYDHHLIHDDGDWTWVGKVQTDHGMQSAVITFGKDAVFGLIPQATGNPLRLVTADGQKMLVQTDGAKMAASPLNQQLYASQDFKVPGRKSAASTTRVTSVSATARSSAASTQTAVGASTTGGPTVDVMVAYTNGYASAQGSTSAALTRINNLVDITNQAYADSGVNQHIRLVYTMEVNYTDTNDNTQALDALTGNDGNGNGVPIPSSLQGVASARAQYGADLVVLLRKFNNAGNNGCGVGWLIGGGEAQIDPSQDKAFGYSVVQDGSDGGYYCLDSTFAHELGHNMGSAHDRAHADQPGAYSYSYGYLGNGANGFSTIMAYGSDTQTPLNLFSNPNISSCQNSPCGVADTSTSSADNAHSLNNTASLIAQFEPTKVALPSNNSAVNDINGDGKTDLLWRSHDGSGFAYWLLNGPTVQGGQSYSTGGFRLAATGDFNGDGITDLIWTNGSAVYAWVGDGSGGYKSQLVGYYGSDWYLVGAGDINGDGKPDLLWHSRKLSAFAFWIMNGLTPSSEASFPISSAYWFAGSGDFNGDGKLDIVWTNGSAIYVWLGNGTQFFPKLLGYYGDGWVLKGVADIDGDGAPDLLFHNQPAASFAYWIVRNTTVVRSAVFPIGVQYSVGAIGDFNGDGKADVMWTDGSALYEWLGDGNGFASHYVANYGDGWTLIQMGEPQ